MNDDLNLLHTRLSLDALDEDVATYTNTFDDTTASIKRETYDRQGRPTQVLLTIANDNSYDYSDLMLHPGSRPAVDQPSPLDLVVELRETVGLFNGALPVSPREAWDEAIAEVKSLASTPVGASVGLMEQVGWRWYDPRPEAGWYFSETHPTWTYPGATPEPVYRYDPAVQ